jgi:hypothetical protein
MGLLARHVPQKLIKKNHSKAYPERMIYFDTESTWTDAGPEQIHRLRMAWACYVRRRTDREKNTEIWRFFDTPVRLWKWFESLAEEERPIWVFSHNIYFDLQLSGFFRWFSEWGWELDFIYSSQLTYILVVKKGKKTFRFISSTNYFDFSLEKLGELVGLPKLEVDFSSASDPALSYYCHRDVEILKAAMEQYFSFLQTHDAGRFGMTKAAQSFNCYRHRFMKTKILAHSHADLVDLESQAYLGGRTEVFFLGEVPGGPFATYDVNSMYPFVMKRNFFPAEFVVNQENFPVKRLGKALEKYCCVAECLVETDRPVFAVRSGPKVIYPVGRFRCFLCTGGLELALKRGYLRSIIEISMYRAEDLFSSYVDYWYPLKACYREEGNAVYHELVKKFLNSLYGKFAQMRPIQEQSVSYEGEKYMKITSTHEVTGEKTVEYKLMNTWIRQTGKEIGSNALMAISAHITEYARLTLWSIMEGVGLKRVLYCDTDSIKLRSSDSSWLRYPVDKERLGALKLEGESKRLFIWGPKSYMTENKTTLKGVPRKAVKNERGNYEYVSFPKQDTHLRRGIIEGFHARKVEKVQRMAYDKGVVNPDGTISPFRLSEF